ncbi:hypothetical protein JCGZ_16891 [Jatropha curcas]|uniref:Uncharacterized protein n=1 Tax=Jatropha curcas TaxID=180498 RepID=A0A067LHB7_JATCU|nr:hypothetical protein JCGZ_16891 [Jatropha curcas]
MEIAAAIGGALLAPAFESLFNKLASKDLLNYAREGQVLTEINKWKERLESIYGVLEDAEEKQMVSKSVKMWVSQLRNLAYDLEDILDEFDFEARRSKLKAKPVTGSSRVRKLFVNRRAIKVSEEMISKIKGISSRLEEITSRRNQLDLSERTGTLRERIPTTCLVNNAEIYGRERDKKAILELLNSESSDRRVALITIVGLGGVGKTTLAQLIFNEAGKKFDLTAWVSVGEDFDVVRLTKTVLQSMMFGTRIMTIGQSFFRPFENGAKESRIIVTTRNLGVSRTMGAVQSYTLRVLETDDCLSVFAHHALGVTNFEEHLDLEAIGKKIVERCQGLPLAAKAIGGLLRGQPTPDAWEQVLNSGIWEEKSDILRALKLSYHHLPSHLKQCFAYCAIFPKDYEFDEDELVLQWMAEGFRGISTARTGNEANETLGVVHDIVPKLKRLRVLSVAQYRFEELSSSIGALKHLRYLDLSYNTGIIRLPNSLSNLQNLQTLKLCGCRNLIELPTGIGALIKLMHLDLKGTEALQEMPLGVANLINLQTLSKFMVGKGSNCLGIRELMNLPHLEGQLRIEELQNVARNEGTNLVDLKKIENLGDLALVWTDKLRDSPCEEDHEFQVLNMLEPHQKLERLLVRFYGGKKFPLWIGDPAFTNMVDLELSNCRNITLLPPLGGLPKLEKLSIKGMDELLEGSTNLDKLSCLKSLRIVGCQRLVSLVGGEEGNLPCNLEILKIWECDGLENLPNGLQTLTSLRGLSIHWCPKLVSFPSAGLPCSLKSLEIVYCPSLKSLPQGILHDSNARNEISHLEVVSVGGCPSLTSLPIGEFPYSIKNIDICFWTTRLLDSFHNRFSNLTKLAIYDSELESFPESGLAIPNLSRLTIRNCGNLRLLPNQIQNLTSLHDLEIHSCGDLVSFPDEGLPPNLTSLSILRCENLRSLPNQMQNLTSLQRLQMCNCGGLVSFPDGGLPPKLGRLTISNCKNLKQPISEWRLKTLASLTCLTIAGPCPSTDMDSFPDEKGPLLPSSLTSLQIGDFKNLKSISRGIHHLTSLDALEIRNCPKLQSFPKEGLPSTLESLAIFECPLLERRCRKEKGDYWRFIANIPSFIQKSPEIQ